jgi:hypothetical protein
VAATFLTPPLDFDQLNHTGLSINHQGSIVDDGRLGHADANGGGMSRRAAAASMDEARRGHKLTKSGKKVVRTQVLCVFFHVGIEEIFVLGYQTDWRVEPSRTPTARPVMPVRIVPHR